MNRLGPRMDACGMMNVVHVKGSPGVLLLSPCIHQLCATFWYFVESETCGVG